MIIIGQKSMIDAKGGRDFEVYWKGFQARVKVLKESWNAGRYE